MTEIDQRSLTPCLDENRDEGNGGENSKEIELSDISDDEEEWPDQEARNGNGNGNGKSGEKFGFKKITRSNRDRNYRYKQDEHNKVLNEHSSSSSRKRKSENYRRKEILRYDVRKVVATRDFSMSRSRSRSISPKPTTSRYQDTSFSPRQRVRRSQSPILRPFHIKTHRYSPVVPSRHSPSPTTDRYHRTYQQYRSPTPEKMSTRRSRSKHKHNKLSMHNAFNFTSILLINLLLEATERDEKVKKHRRSKDHQHKHNKKSLSPSPEQLSSPTELSSRQIMNINSNLTQENIKVTLKNVTLKNDDVGVKRQKTKKRDKKGKKDKSSRRGEKPSKEQLQKNVFASGDNILISVCFNKNNNNNNNAAADDKNSHNVVDEKSKDDKVGKKKKRQPSPTTSISSADSHTQKRVQRKHKHKKHKEQREKETPRTPPLKPLNPNAITAPATTLAKRKNDMKPIAIIDLEKSPGKEIILSPKEIIVLSDSDGNNFESGGGGKKDIIIVEDITIIDKNTALDLLSPKHATPESPPPAAQPVLKFALKSKSNILPFNLLHDQADEVEDLPPNTTNVNANMSIMSSESGKEQQETANIINVSNDNKNLSNQSQNDAYDPFEPTKSRSTSPMTPPHPHPNDISSSSDTLKNKIDSLNEKIQKDSNLNSGMDVPPSSIWIRKEFDVKKNSLMPQTPPKSSSYLFSGSSSQQISKQPNVSSLYDGIYGSDLKTPVLPSPNKSKYINNNKKNIEEIEDDDDDDDDFSPSTDGYDDNEPAPHTSMHASGKSAFETIKHSDIDTQSSEPSGSYSFNADDTTTTKTTPLKLTASTLKTFNSTMRSAGLNFKGIYENFLPTSQVQNSPHVKRQTTTTTTTENSHFIRSKVSRFSSNLNENGSPLRNIMSYNEPLKPSVIGMSN